MPTGGVDSQIDQTGKDEETGVGIHHVVWAQAVGHRFIGAQQELFDRYVDKATSFKAKEQFGDLIGGRQEGSKKATGPQGSLYLG